MPDGVVLCDDLEVLPEERLFRAHGGYAAFAHLFRYTLLAASGGLWLDTDVVCLIPAEELRSRLPNGFLVTQFARDRRKRRINSNLIYLPAPRRGDIVDLALAITGRFDRARLKWADCGPKLFRALAKAYPDLLPPVMEPDFANPLSPHECPVHFTAPAGRCRAMPRCCTASTKAGAHSAWTRIHRGGRTPCSEACSGVSARPRVPVSANLGFSQLMDFRWHEIPPRRQARTWERLCAPGFHATLNHLSGGA